jgi:hypothetical protein
MNVEESAEEVAAQRAAVNAALAEKAEATLRAVEAAKPAAATELPDLLTPEENAQVDAYRAALNVCHEVSLEARTGDHDVNVFVRGDRYVISSSATGEHSLDIGNTDRARLLAHVLGFIARQPARTPAGYTVALSKGQWSVNSPDGAFIGSWGTQVEAGQGAQAHAASMAKVR